GCHQKADPNDPMSVQKAETSDNPPDCSPVGCLDLPDWDALNLKQAKRRLYNLAQIFDVLEENLPGSGSPLAGGLKFFRSLFFQFNLTTPERYQDELAGDQNNL